MYTITKIGKGRGAFVVCKLCHQSHVVVLMQEGRRMKERKKERKKEKEQVACSKIKFVYELSDCASFCFLFEVYCGLDSFARSQL